VRSWKPTKRSIVAGILRAPLTRAKCRAARKGNIVKRFPIRFHRKGVIGKAWPEKEQRKKTIKGKTVEQKERPTDRD